MASGSDPTYVQAFASRKRAAYWRNLDFAHLTRPRIAAATIHEMRRNKYGDETLVDCLAGLKRPPMWLLSGARSCSLGRPRWRGPSAHRRQRKYPYVKTHGKASPKPSVGGGLLSMSAKRSFLRSTINCLPAAC
jgi:hypothetical protein